MVVCDRPARGRAARGTRPCPEIAARPAARPVASDRSGAAAGVPCNIPPRCVKPARSSSCSSASSPWSIDFLPGLQLPDSTSADGAWRTVETKLGLDLEGGLRVEYQALPGRGQGADAGRHGDHQGHRRAPREHDRRLRAGRHDPGRRPRRRRAAGRHRPRGGPPARRPDRPARLRAARLDPGDRGPDARPEARTRRCSAATRSPRRPSAPTRTGARPSTSCSRTTARTCSPTYTARQHRQLLRDHPRRRRHLRAGHPELDPERQRPDHRRRARPGSRPRTRPTS